MRIIAGSHRGRSLRQPRQATIRPTARRARQRIFDILTQGGPAAIEISGARILDLFAGSGMLGIEALSRGAAQAVFIDRDRRACHNLRMVLDRLELMAQAVILCRDMRRLPSSSPFPPPFDCVFIDPPYGTDWVAPTLSRLTGEGWLKPTTRLVVEHRIDTEVLSLAGYRLLDQRETSITRHLFLAPNEEA